MNATFFRLLIVLAFLSTANVPLKADTNEAPIPLEDPAIQGGSVARHGNRLVLTPESISGPGSMTIPRMSGCLNSSHWSEMSDSHVAVQPEPKVWIIKWDKVPDRAKEITLSFDQTPKLLTELEPVTESGDHSIMLHAFQATTTGEKIRYEPQRHKNTVGYWANPKDTATWHFSIKEPHSMNVGILQGCGKGQGGSIAAVTIKKEDDVVATLEFEVLETGHFQNFQWRHLGEIKLPEAGVYSLTIEPKKIAKGALMDVRAVSLTALPSP